jgi:DNA-binding winged helix-turn-helix (wHTH) protein/tetratricopeptide (TPR) repeat protein
MHMRTSLATPAPPATGRRIQQCFRFGDWLVDPGANAIECAGEKRQMEPRTMAVLVALCQARGALLSSDELLTQCWGSTLSGDSPLHKNIAQLRRILGDSASAPRYIETIRMRGYRTVAPLDFSAAQPGERKRWSKGSPFRGLLAFDADHADVFFGRDEVIRTLVQAVDAQVAGGLALMLVLGPSGSGKTSLVQAGLLPALARAPAAARLSLLASTGFDLVDQGRQTLFTALAGTLLDLQWEDRWAFPGENALALGARLEHRCDTVVAELCAALAPARAARPGARFGIFIDRFEALFNAARVTDAERGAFLHTLEQLARSSAVLVVVACRNDFYPSVAQYPLLIEAKRHGGHFDLGPPGFAEIAQMIRRPAAAAGLSFGTDPVSGARLDDVLCASAAGRPDALPLLQYCLQELYRLRTGEGELGFEAFHQLGDLEGAIGQRAEEVVLGLDETQRAALGHIMSLVIILSGDGGNVSSQRAPWAALRDEHARQAVTALVENRLFVSDLAGGTPVFGIAHDAILRRWPRMTDWIAAHRSALGARGRLAQHAGRWHEEGRPADLLLPHGKLLHEARELRQAGVWSLLPHELELIEASDRSAHQRGHRQMAALVLIVALAVLASGLGVSALLAKRAAELRRSEAESLMDFMLGDFADKLRPLGRLDLLAGISGKALPFLSSSDDAGLSPAELTLRARNLQIIAEVSRSRGDSVQALDALNKAQAILMRQHRLAPRDAQVLKSLGANAYWVAQIHKDRSNWQAAEAALRDYLQYADLLHRYEPGKIEWWVEQSYAHNNLGALALARGQPASAAPAFEASIALKRRALEHAPAPADVAAELADSYSWLASAREALGQLGAAQQLYAQELALVLRLRARFPADSMWTYRQVRALQHRAAIGVARGQDAHALGDYEEARRLFAPLVEQDRDNRAWRVELAGLEQARLRILGRRAGAGALLAPLREVHRTLQGMLALDPNNASWARREALSRTRLAAALLAGGKAQEGERERDAARASLQGLYARNPLDVNVRLALVENLLLTAVMKKPDLPAESAILNCRQAYGMISKEADMTMNYQILDPWVRINVCLQNHVPARMGVKRLQQIDYRDNSFLQFMTVPLVKEEYGT